MRSRLLFPLLTTAACLAAAVPASAATPEAVSENWAGYEAAPQGSTDFSAVSGDWTEPKVTCTSGSPTYSAYWVGLGGASQQSDALEQVGTQSDCSASGKASYYAWYELVPKAPVNLKLAVNPGDQISARTAVDGSNVTVTLKDVSSGQSVSKTLQMSNPDTTTAEWVAEAPSECAGDAASNCTPLPLADFQSVKFNNAHATAGGHTGTISDSHWQSQAISLQPNSDGFTGPGYGGWSGGFGGGYGGGSYSAYGEAASADSAGANPSALSNGGQSFTVSYGSTGSGSSSTGSGSGYGSTYPGSSAGSGSGSSGYGYGGGYGDGSGDGYGDGGYGSAGGYGGGYSYGDGGYGYGYGDGSYGDGGYGDGYGYGDGGYGDAYSYGYGDGGYTDAYSYGDASGDAIYGAGWAY